MVYKIALRELRGGLRDFRLFLGCLVVGITVIAAVGVLSGRIEQGIRRDARALLGGDVEISIVNQRANPGQLAFLRTYGKVSLALSLRAMAASGTDATLVELKGVDDAYPLLGSASLASPASLQASLGGGRIVIGDDLRDRLAVKPGDRITIGDASFVISDILLKEPDRIAGAFSLGPRVIASVEDLEKAGMLRPGNLIRYNYRLQLAHPATLDAFRQEIARRYPKAPWILKTYNENNRTVQGLVERLQLFLTLAGLSSLLIGGVGILNAARSYIGSKSTTIATFKALGAKRGTVFAVYMLVLSVITLLGILISSVLGMLLSALLLPYLAQFFPVSLDASADGGPLLLAAAFGVLTVFTFSVAAVARGIEVRPALLFRATDETVMGRLARDKLALNILLAAAFIALVTGTAEDRKIAAGFIVLALMCFAVFMLAAKALRLAAARLRLPAGMPRLALAGLHRPGAPVFSIMLSIGMGLSVMVALLLVEGNVDRDIKESIPALAPSLFLFDIQPSQKEAVASFLASKSYVSDVASEPMVRGRISKLKGVPVERAPISDDVRWATESDRGFSFAATPPPGTRMTDGAWWPADYRGKPLVSFDRKLARGMGLALGDTLTINILGEDIDATIANLRDVNYMSLRINFALIFSPGAIERFPSSGITTLHVAGRSEETALVRDITRAFPNISAVRISESLAQFQEIVGHISTAVQVTALFSLVSGVMVLASALAASLHSRAYDTMMFKVLGARKRDILALFLAEWLCIAFVTGLLSCAFGAVGAWLILQRLEWVEFHLLYGRVAAVMLLTLLFIAATGLLLNARTFALKPGVILRNE